MKNLEIRFCFVLLAARWWCKHDRWIDCAHTTKGHINVLYTIIYESRAGFHIPWQHWIYNCVAKITGSISSGIVEHNWINYHGIHLHHNVNQKTTNALQAFFHWWPQKSHSGVKYASRFKRWSNSKSNNAPQCKILWHFCSDINDPMGCAVAHSEKRLWRLVI